MSETFTRISTPHSAAIQIGDRPDNYYKANRQDIADLLPPAARRVLEIGCGEGRLGQLLRTRGHYVAGFELVPEIAEKARQNLDEVYCGDIEQTQLALSPESFDALIFADILEHLVDPWKTLKNLARLLRPGGLTIASIPNVQNHRIVRDLLRGKWQYTDSGLMDRGHLRFFTYRQIVALYDGAGLDVIDHRSLYSRNLRRRILLALTFGKIEPFLARQYLVVGRKRAAA
jgi:2-polyprenyl-3-methyl-5-hydroxy-6-metoxy-1,4-benzoquinol methylase